jgi:hypothetical protein
MGKEKGNQITNLPNDNRNGRKRQTQTENTKQW